MSQDADMKIGYTMSPGRGDTDQLLFNLVQDLTAAGFVAGGAVQINTELECDGPCDMDVQVLPDGPVLRISQSLGKDSRGCRLDPSALETAVGQVEAALAKGVDFVVINKFGKHEASGRGFRPVIAQALASDIPVLVGANRLNLEAFQEFTGHCATEVAPQPEAVKSWLLGHMTAARSAAE